MLAALWLVLGFPLISFILLATVGHRIHKRWVALLGAGSVGMSAIVAILLLVGFVTTDLANHSYIQHLWTWINLTGFEIDFRLHLDALSLVMVLVITIVGFLIHLYATEYMHDDAGYARFFAYMNLFVVAMLILVLADNYFVLYLGWEGVGLCSFLLIGFWYQYPKNKAAARKAFIVTRIGDTAMAVALYLIYSHLGTLDIQEVMRLASQHWQAGSTLVVLVALLLLGGAVGKSAQLPLQTWLPDAMAGPTPVSALIHAATMVTAGFYLIARSHGIFELAPLAMQVVAWVGAATLVMAGFCALVQSDIKRVLAYSTISQIGYMFLALGVGAYSAAVFHFATHAVFKALLFMGAGAIIICLHHEQNMFRMGGLKTRLPIVYWTFLIAGASLAALPFVTAGFYSKDLILWQTWASAQGSIGLWLAGIVGALLTALYTARMICISCFGPAKTEPTHQPSWAIHVPLVFLALLSTVLGFIEIPAHFGQFTLLSDLLRDCLPVTLPLTSERSLSHATEWILMGIAMVCSVGGVWVGWTLFSGQRRLVGALGSHPLGARLHRFLFEGFGFDRLYDTLLGKPFRFVAHINRADCFDLLHRTLIYLFSGVHDALSAFQTGRVRHVVMGFVTGVIALLTLAWVLS